MGPPGDGISAVMSTTYQRLLLRKSFASRATRLELILSAFFLADVPESSAKVKAGIVVTLGKMSLQCERLAKSMVAVLGRLLGSTDNSNIKSNVMIALADLTIR